MGSINDKIASLKGYFKGMNVAEGFVYVTVEFPEGWFINDDLCAHYEVRAAKEKNDGTYYFFTSLGIGFDAVFDAILETIKYNEVSALKKSLFLEKINELQKIFETETLETLNTIEFKYTQQKKKSSKKNNKASQSKENKKTNEEVSSEMTDDNTLEEHIAETKKESSDVRTITPPENITSHYDLSKVLG